jgi:hypothetical protein
VLEIVLEIVFQISSTGIVIINNSTLFLQLTLTFFPHSHKVTRITSNQQSVFNPIETTNLLSNYSLRIPTMPGVLSKLIPASARSLAARPPSQVTPYFRNAFAAGSSGLDSNNNISNYHRQYSLANQQNYQQSQQTRSFNPDHGAAAGLNKQKAGSSGYERFIRDRTKGKVAHRIERTGGTSEEGSELHEVRD